MISFQQLQKQALSFPEVTEEPHFEKTSFRVKKKIFATYDKQLHRLSLKLSLIDQDVFVASDAASISSVPNKWGKQGWTYIDLNKVAAQIFEHALSSAYCAVAPPNLSHKVKSTDTSFP